MKNYPQINVTPPGPNAKKVIEMDEEYTSTSYIKEYPLVVERGEGTMVQDVDGNRFLDFMAGIAVVTTGHSHPKVVEAIKKAADKFLHICPTDFYYPSFAELAKKMAEIAPGPSKKKVFLGNSGTEAIEAAIKLSRYHTRRSRLISFFGAFHGRSMGALSLTASKMKQRQHFSPFLPGVTHVPFGYCYRCPYNLKYPSCNLYCVNVLEDEYFEKMVPPDDVAAVFVEPIQGEGGYIVPPPGYHNRLKEICEKYGILYVADEVQSGMGRTGKWFASEHYGIEPDIITVAKGIASGMPVSAMVAKSDVMTWPSGSHGSTFGGNPVACEAAIATIELVEDELMENATNVGNYLMKQLESLSAGHRLIGDFRGVGLMIGIEFVRDRNTKEKAKEETELIVQKAFHKGLLLLGCGENIIRLAPPLIVDKEDADLALNILDEVLTDIENAGVESVRPAEVGAHDGPPPQV
jgi:4-aminobutyrate aminotransferase